MVIRVVKFKSGLTESEVCELFEKRAPEYRKVPGLRQKYYTGDAKTGEFGGIYVWDSPQATEDFLRGDLARSRHGTYKLVDQPETYVADVVLSLWPEKR